MKGGDILLIVKDIYGEEEGFVGYKGLKRNRTKDGEKTLAFLAIPDVNNQHSYPLIQNESTVEFDGDTYRIKQLKEKSKGKVTFKEVVAIHTFFDLIDEHIYEVYNGSMTFENAAQFVLGPYGYTWSIIGTFYAQEWENFGDDNPIALFQEMIKRYKAEFTLNGTHLTFKNKIGNATDFQLRYNYNIKSIEKNSDTSNFSTYIRGFGKDGLEAEYISPLDEANGGPYKRKHAKPVRDEKYTTHDGLMERLQSEIPSIIPFSVTVDFLDLRRAGYPYDVPNEGDDMFVIHEPMKMDLESRIMVIDEEFTEGNPYPIKTNVTIANYKSGMTDKFIEFSRTQKTVTSIMDGNTELPYSVVDGAIRRATEALQSAQTELEFVNGIIARSKVNPNHLVLLNSSGIGVSLDGGQTFETAMTAEGIVADLITVGTMLFDRLQGGNLKLGHAYADGVLEVWVDRDEDGKLEIVARIDDDGAYFPNLSSDNIRGNVVNKWMGSKNLTFYIDCNNGNDANDGLSTATPKKSLQAFINNLPKDLNGATLTLRCKGSHSGSLVIENFKNGFFQIAEWDATNYLNTNYVWAQFCDYVLLQNVVVWGTGGSNGMVHAFYCNFFYAFATKCYGGPSQSNSYWMIGSKFSLNGCEVYGITDRGLYADRSSVGTVINGIGNPPVAILAENGSIVNGYGSIWGGSKVASDGGDIPNLSAWSSINTGVTSPPTPTPNQNAEQTLTIVPSTGDNYSSNGYWTNDEVKQGSWGTNGNRYGLWYADLSAVRGKTIVSATITLNRKSGGNSGARTVYLRSHNYTSRGVRPGGAPAMSVVGATASLAVGQTGTFDITAMIQNHIANGTDSALGVHTTGSTDYMSLGTTPTITIRYK